MGTIDQFLGISAVMSFTVRIVVSALLGGIIGIERQRHDKVAGIAPHMLISMAACLMMIISKYAFMDVVQIEGISLDASRIAAGIITGTGILSGGIIFIRKSGNVSGMNTAAGIWVTIGIGMGIGAGLYSVCIASVVIMLIIKLPFNVNRKVFDDRVKAIVTFKMVGKTNGLNAIEEKLLTEGITIHAQSWKRKADNEFTARCQVILPHTISDSRLVELLSEIPEFDTVDFA